MEILVDFLSSPGALTAWLALAALSEIILRRNLLKNNGHLMGLMKIAWALTVLYSGPLGLIIHWTCGRTEIPRNTLARGAFQSVPHC